ncbi:hypothetical protein JCM16303_001270 [Sporobolomyces ruberrimus]
MNPRDNEQQYYYDTQASYATAAQGPPRLSNDAAFRASATLPFSWTPSEMGRPHPHFLPSQFPSYPEPPQYFPSHVGPSYPPPPLAHSRNASQLEPQLALASLPQTFDYSSQPLPSPPSHSDLCALRSRQSQRKRELSGSIARNERNPSTNGLNQTPQEVADAPSTLLGFAGEERRRTFSQGGHNELDDWTRDAMGRSVSLSASTLSTSSSSSSRPGTGNFDDPTQLYWELRNTSTTSGSVDPSPPLHQFPGGGGIESYPFEFFQPPTSFSSSLSSIHDATPLSQYDQPVQTVDQQYLSQHVPPSHPPTISQLTTLAQSDPILSLPLSSSLSQIPTPPRFPEPPRSSNLPTSSSTSNPHPNPKPQTLPTLSTPSSLLTPDLVPILSKGLQTRLKHYESTSPLSTRPARNKVNRPSLGTRTPTTESLNDSSAREGDVEGKWKIGKNASGKKITSLELRIDCERDSERRGGGNGAGGKCCCESGRGGKERKVAKIVLRNLSGEMLKALEGIDGRLEERNVSGGTPDEANETEGRGGRKSTRPRSATFGSSTISGVSPCSDSALTSPSSQHSTSSTLTPNPATPSSLSLTPTLSPPHELNSESISLSTIPRELGIALENSSCLVCAGLASPRSTLSPDPSTADGEAQPKERGYEDTLSAAIDRFERLNLGNPDSPGDTTEKDEENKEETKQGWEGLVHLEPDAVPKEYSNEVLRCDVCNLVCGLSNIVYTDPTLSPSDPSRPEAHEQSTASTSTGSRPFTVEVICARCDALFKACTDCGGGGGRLTPGKWRCKELFPDGRKNCQLSHARNPTLDEISIVINPVSSLSSLELDSASSACRKLFFNTRLGTLCRPEFMLKGDGLANSFQQAENLSIDYWGRLDEVLRGELPQDSPMKRYLVITYSQPRPRHPPKTARSRGAKGGVKDEDFDDEFDLGEPEPAPPSTTRKKRGKASGTKKVVGQGEGGKMDPWAFSIVEVDFSVGVLFFCCVIPWATSGQSFDANSLLIERTNELVKSDLVHLNRQRQQQGLPPYPRLEYNFIVSPFRLDSKNSQNLNRRGYYTLDQMEENGHKVERKLFPPYREIWLPAHYGRATHVFVRRLENEQDMGGPPKDNAPRKRKKKATG